MSSEEDIGNANPPAVNEPDTPLRGRLLRYGGRVVRFALMVTIYALVLWFSAETSAQLSGPPVLVGVAVALIALGITGSIYGILIAVAKEAKGAIMVIADFLNTHLVEPRKRRLIERGRVEGRAETVAKGRARLIEQGIDPDLIFPPEEDRGDDTGHDTGS